MECVLNFQELTSKHQDTGIKKTLENHSLFSEKKNGKLKLKPYKESFKRFCQVCGLMLSSKLQAQEHFFGKRHQNVVKSRDFDYQNYRFKLKLVGQNTTEKKNLIVLDGLHNPSKTSFNQNLGSDYEICDSVIIPPPAGRDNILETVIKSEKKTFYSSDLSIYRTPSGKYYCQTCNITIISQAQFLQHLKSRKHKHKATKSSSCVK